MGATESSGPGRAPPGQGQGQTIEVVGLRLDQLRDGLSPKTGTSQYVFSEKDIDLLPRGESTTLDQLMLQAAGVAHGDYGQLYIRGEMTQPQYRINGTIIPEGISGFGQAFDLRLARRVDFVTGALPAQYNYRTNIVDIETKQIFSDGAKFSLSTGSYGLLHPALEVSGAGERLNYYATVSHLKADNGILFPTADRQPLHNDTAQSKGFGLVSFFPDPNSRVTLMLSAARSKYQIPNVRGEVPQFSLDGLGDVPDLPSENLDERQLERSNYAVLSYQADAGQLNYQVSAYARSSSVQFTPDRLGDLIYRGIASSVSRRNRSQGLQVDAGIHRWQGHTLRAGFSWNRQRTASANTSEVFPAADDGMQVPGSPLNVVDARTISADLAGAYLQDEWQATRKLSLNYGARVDVLHGLTRNSQLSPRFNAVYQWNAATALHAGYARYFNPPRLELIGPDTVSKFANTTNQPEVQRASPVVPERVHYFDVGLAHQITPHLSLGLDTYAKRTSHMVDFGQFGQALVYSPFNWTQARVFGLEVTGRYRTPGVAAYVNLALSRARARGISSGEYNFEQEELDHINGHWVSMDHDQRLTASAGIAWRAGGAVLSADAFFGSGMRRTPEGGIPNRDHMPGYARVNVGVAREFTMGRQHKLGLRLAMINLFDRIYEIRDGTGVGVGAPQFGQRRSLHASASITF